MRRVCLEFEGLVYIHTAGVSDDPSRHLLCGTVSPHFLSLVESTRDRLELMCWSSALSSTPGGVDTMADVLRRGVVTWPARINLDLSLPTAFPADALMVRRHGDLHVPVPLPPVLYLEEIKLKELLWP